MSELGTDTVAPTDDLQPVDWGTIDDALYDWLNDKLEMDDRIIWENRSEPQPDYPYLSLLRSPEVSEGGVKETRRLTITDDGLPTGTPTDVKEFSYEPVSFTLTVTAHVSLEAGGRDPNTNAMKLLSKAKASLGLRTVIDTLSSAGLSVVQDLDALDTSILINGEWVKKATLDVIFRTASVMTELQGFMNKVELKSTELGVDELVDAS